MAYEAHVEAALLMTESGQLPRPMMGTGFSPVQMQMAANYILGLAGRIQQEKQAELQAAQANKEPSPSDKKSEEKPKE